ncbi:MAG TPA: hypothetical protein VG324_16785, partial [Blastocatellia bacterium]|nr:hypothetical protein [Blastocatellia bacterium]
PSRGATVDEGEGKTDECSDELTTISTVAPRLDNHSLPQPALKRRPKFNRRSATKKRLPGNAKDLGNDKPHGLTYRHIPYTDLITALVRVIAILVQYPEGAKVAGFTPGRRAANPVQGALRLSKTPQP